METRDHPYHPVDPDLWSTIERWFHHLADLPEEDQQRELNHLKQTEPETYEWLKTLLAEDGDSHPLLSRSAQDILGDWQQDSGMTGSMIGAFLLKEHLGQGAMGSVFRAERNDGQFNQTVALKLMKSVIHDDTLQQFFKEERQILAGLNHPHIARLYDGGFTDSGRPYFTMEYISGEPVTEYCFRRNLSIRKRIEIFLQICDAVSFAHRSLIVHLDLKPKNIIVDNDGQVKLLDFGVAKLLKQHPTGEREDQSSHRFTLAYASPEQLTAGRISTSSDLYALGTILYELISSVHPFHHHLENISSLKEAILTETPGPLSSRLSAPAHSDLDAICQKALRKKTEERYESVGALARDLVAYLSDYPVKARKNTPGYLTTRFLRRNRKMVAASILSVVLLATTIVYYTNRLADERDLAVKEATRSAEIVNLLTDVFTAADPNTGSGDTLTAVQLLDQGLEKLEGNLKNQPELLASMLMQITPIYLNLGRYDKADSLARVAMKVQNTLFESPNKNLAGNLVMLGKVTIANGDLDSAEMLITKGIAQYQQLRMNDGFEMADALIELSDVYYLKGQYLESDSIYQIAYAIHTKKLTPPHAELAYDLHTMGTTLRKLGKYEEAEKYLLESLEMKRKLYKQPHLEIAFTLNHLGSLKQNMGDWRGSIPYIRESLKQRKTILGSVHIESIASQSNLARAYSNLSLLDSAIIVYEDALAKIRVVFPKGHYYVAAIMQSLAQAHLNNNDVSEAEDLFRESIAMQDGLIPEDDVNRAFAWMGLGRTLMKKEEYRSAEKPLRDALNLRSKYLPASHELIGVSQQALGECLLAMQNYPTAIGLLEDAYSSLQKHPDKYEEELDTILHDLTKACQENNLPDKAAHYQTLLANR
jgi:serine/threonine-protein kinase